MSETTASFWRGIFGGLLLGSIGGMIWGQFLINICLAK